MRRETRLKLITICAAIVLFNTGYARAGTWTTLDYPGAIFTQIGGISGGSVVGMYSNSSGYNHGFLYNAGNWTTLDYPGGEGTEAFGISGSSVVGMYGDTGDSRGFLYNAGNWTNLDYPGARGTYISGISGSNVAGGYYDNSGLYHGFLYNGGNWTTLDYLGATETAIFGIDGSNLVGEYSLGDTPYTQHGFIYTIPEPATLLLLGLGAVMLRKHKKCSVNPVFRRR
jgi:hypothetical protein